jgi:class 3 adenylate cyclase
LCIGEENIYGDEMNVASKLGEDVAEPNEILVTESAFNEAGDELSDLNPDKRSIKVSGVDLTYYAVNLDA